MGPQTNPWRFVDADDDLVADLLAGTVEAVLDAGGWVHPGARFIAREGQLSVDCEALVGEPLMRIPRAAFIRIGRVDWADDPDRLAFEGVPDEFGEAETELLYLQTALHNACGKLPWLTRTHPVLAPDLSDAVVDAMRAFRPSFRVDRPTAAGVLWSNRVFRLPMADGGDPEPVAMPLIDLLDHHHAGATASLGEDSFSVSVGRGDSSGEAPTACLLDYGLRRDAIGMAVVYGFADTFCPVAHSAPCTVEVPGVGVVEVLARGRASTGELLPPIIARKGDHLAMSRLTFGDDDAPWDLSDDVELSAVQRRAIITAVAERNAELLDALRAAASACESASARVVHDAALRQRQVIDASMLERE